MRKLTRKIKVTIQGEITDFNKNLYNERLAIALLDEYGRDTCIELVKLLDENIKTSKK